MLKLILSITLLFTGLLGGAQTQHPADGKLFDSAIISRVDIQLAAADLAFLFDDDNRSSDQHFPATFVFTYEDTRDTLENVGFRLRGNTTRGAHKKAFKVSFNTFETGRKYRGVEKLNLNPEKNDPTLSRSHLCWNLAQQIGIPAARTNYVELYINGDYFGLYLNTEHIDEQFVEQRFGNQDGNLYKCLFPADLVYKDSNPTTYKEVIYGRRAYDLKTNTEADDYSDLANFIAILNNTPTTNLSCVLEEIFNVDGFLKTVAFDVLTGNWDGALYNKNNFYLYHNSATGKFEYIAYDLDNTLGIDWLGSDWSERNIYRWARTSQPRPLFYKIMAVEEYQDRYSYYLQQFMTQYFNLDALNYFVNELPEQLLPYVQRDTYYPRDHGFKSSDFINYFTEPTESDHVDYSIADFIHKRRARTQEQLVLNNIPPVVSHLAANNFTGNNGILISATVVDDVNLAKVEVCYHAGEVAEQTCLAMSATTTNRYEVRLPDFAQEQVFYQIRATDNTNKTSQSPRCNYATARFTRANSTLAINEFMASNESTIADEAGEFDDWVELYNYGSETIFLGDKYLSDKPDNPVKWLMPELSLAAGEYLLIWLDEDGSQGDLHANFKLSAGGEFIGIFDSDSNGNALIDGLEFGEQSRDVAFGRLPNGTGDFQELNPTPNASNQPLSINELTGFAVEVQFAPNPFSRFLQLKIENPRRVALQLEIVDLLGRVVLRRAVGQAVTTTQLYTADWASGLYNVVLRTQQEIIYTQQIVKK